MQYVKECLQLLYWIYFKPYTLKQHVREICPEIVDPYADYFDRRLVEAKTNIRLQRYDNQTWWLSIFIPIVISIFSNFSIETSKIDLKWFYSSLFLIGWLISAILYRFIEYLKNDDKLNLLLFFPNVIFFSIIYLYENIEIIFISKIILLPLPVGMFSYFLNTAMRREATYKVLTGTMFGIALSSLTSNSIDISELISKIVEIIFYI